MNSEAGKLATAIRELEERQKQLENELIRTKAKLSALRKADEEVRDIVRKSLGGGSELTSDAAQALKRIKHDFKPIDSVGLSFPSALVTQASPASPPPMREQFQPTQHFRMPMIKQDNGDEAQDFLNSRIDVALDGSKHGTAGPHVAGIRKKLSLEVYEPYHNTLTDAIWNDEEKKWFEEILSKVVMEFSCRRGKKYVILKFTHRHDTDECWCRNCWDNDFNAISTLVDKTIKIYCKYKGIEYHQQPGPVKN